MLPGFNPGSRVLDYTIVELLGRGGMGAVWKARDEKSGVLVAIKTLLPPAGDAPAQSERAVQRFLREARLAAEVVHENVVAVRFAGEHQGAPVLVCDYLPGGSLEDRLAARGRLPWREAARFGSQIASGLAAIHARGFVHRDLKPANVLLDERGIAKVADFGLARRTSGNSVDLTRSGDVVGTYAFLSPEQATGSGEVDHRADLYSLGGTLFALLTGEPPFSAPSSMFLLAKHASEKPRSPRDLVPEVPRDVASLVLRLLAKDPAARPQAAETAALLESLLAGKGLPSRRRGPGRVALALGGAVVVAGAVALSLRGGRPWKSSPERPASPTPSPPGRRAPTPTPAPVARDAGASARDALPEGGRTLFHTRGGTWRLSKVYGRPELRTGTQPGALAFLPDGKRLVAGGSVLRILDVETGRELRTIARSYTQHGVALPDGRLVTAGAERLIWDIERGRPAVELERPTTVTSRQRVSISRDGLRCLLFAPEMPIDILETSNGARVVGLAAFGTDVVAALSADGRSIFLGGAEGQIRRTSLGAEPGTVGAPEAAPITALAVSPAGDRLLVGTAAGTVSVRDASTGRVLASRTHAAPVAQLVFDARGTRAASLGPVVNPASYQPPIDPHVWLYDVGADGSLAERVLEGATADVESVAFSPDGKLVATASWDQCVRIHDAASGKLLRGPHGHTCWVEAVAVSEDGRSLATGGWDGAVRIWDRATGEERRAFQPFKRFVSDLAFAPRGDRVVACDQGGEVVVLDLGREEGASERRIEGLPPRSKRARFSPDGKKLLVACASGALLLCDVDGHAAPADMASPRGTNAGYTSCAFLSDRRALAGQGGGHVELLAPGGDAPAGYVLNVFAVSRAIPKDVGNAAVRNVEVEPGGQRCAALIMGGGVVFFDPSTNLGDVTAFSNGTGADETTNRKPSETIQRAWMRGLALSPDPRAHLAVSTSDDRSVRLWDTRTGASLGAIELSPESGQVPLGVAFVPGGKAIVVGTTAGLALEIECQASGGEPR